MNSRITHLEHVVQKVAERVQIPTEEFEQENPYHEGTEEWWGFEIAAGEADMRAGRYATLESREDIKRYFDNL